MLTFAIKKKRTHSIAPKRHVPTVNPMSHSMHLQQAKVRHILRGPTLQPKLTIGAPNDKYEQEADRVADEVIQMPEPRLQRQVEPEEEEEETLQPKPLANQITPLAQVQRQEEPEEEEEMLQAKPLSDQITPLVQRQVEEEEKEEEEEILQTKENPGQTPEVAPVLESRIQSLKGEGQPLPESTRAFFEPRFGYDFSQMRVHTNRNAVQINRELNAQAFTHGRDIYFGTGRYNTGTSSGKRLLAHELTHVVQQEGMSKSSKKIKAKKTSQKNKPESNDFVLSATRQIQRQPRSFPQSGTHYKWLEDVTIQAPNGWKYRFQLYETTTNLVTRIAAYKKCHILQRTSATKFEKIYRFDQERYAPLYNAGRFYSLYHLPRGHYLTLETFLKNLNYLYKEQKRLKKVMPQIKTAEPQLKHAFGQYWHRVKKILIRKGPFKTPLTNMNFKFKIAEPTASIRAKMAAGLKPNLNVIRVKAEKGLNIVRAGAISTIGIDLVNNNISYTIGNVQLDAIGGAELKFPNKGCCSIGISTQFFNPFSSGVTWKVGCEKKSTFISIGSGPYKYQTYVEFLVEGDLTVTGRVKYATLYAIGTVGIVLLIAKLAAGLAGIQVGQILRPAPVITRSVPVVP